MFQSAQQMSLFIQRIFKYIKHIEMYCSLINVQMYLTKDQDVCQTLNMKVNSRNVNLNLIHGYKEVYQY